MVMRVCMLSTTFPRFQGDMYGNFICLLAKKLVERKLVVKIVCSHYRGSRREERWDGIEIFRYRYMIPETLQRLTYEGGILAALGKNYWYKLLIPFFLFFFLLKGLRVAKWCDLIHAHWTVSGLIALVVGKWQRKPVVLTVHGSDINVLNKKLLFKLLNKAILTRVDGVIAVSPLLKERIGEMGIAPEKLWYIPNGVDTTSFFPPLSDASDRKRILWVGRMSPEKGLDVLINAMREVVREIPQAHLTLVGDGPERGTIERMVRDYQLGGHIRMEGFRSYEEIPQHFRASQVFVLPSLREGLPLVILEAFASGLPCVASHVGGIGAIIEDGVTGYLVSPSSVSELSQKVITLLKSPKVRRALGERARRKVEDHYSWDTIADQTLALYRRVMVSRNG